MSPRDVIEAVWRLSDDLFSSVSEARGLETPIELRNPFIFYLGHLPAFTWNVLRKRDPALPSLNAKYEHLFSRGRDPDMDDPSVCHDHPPPPPVWPTWEQVSAYKETVREKIRHIMDTVDGAVLRLIAEHEAMHTETLYYMLAQANDKPARIPHSGLRTVQWISVPEGKVTLGRPRSKESFSSFGWDNEYQRAVANVPAFEITKHAVTISEFHAFVDAGGYTTQSLWDESDWEWVTREGMKHPASWRLIDGIYHVVTNVGPGRTAEVREISDWPVSVSLAEARAFAKWVRAEIPSEEQWLRAAGTDPVTWEHSICSTPRPVQEGAESCCGAVGMVGNGWELTRSLFERFDGFVAMDLYPEYSSDFFDGKHFVLKGASWATDPVCVRPSFRNFYQAKYPFVFSKFRLVRRPDA